MKRLRFCCAAGLLALMPSLAQADLLDINFGHKSFSLDWSAPTSAVRDANGRYELGLLSRPDDEPEDLLQLHAGFLLSGDAGARDFVLTAGLGARAVYADAGRDRKGGALAFGGQFEARLPQADRFSLGGEAYFAPGVTSFSDLDGMSQLGINLGYEVIRGGVLYVGGRHVRHKYEQFGRGTVDNGMHIGLRLKF